MPRWRVPVEVVVEAASPAAARAQVAQQLAHIAATDVMPTTSAQYHITHATSTAAAPQPLTTRRTIADPQRPIRRKRPV
jgi:hypothetical protein